MPSHARGVAALVLAGFLFGSTFLVVQGAVERASVLPFLAGRIRADYFGEEIGGTLKFYELAFMASIAGWTFYLLITLFFYYADAFSADKRNNAMLFWKSMPVSDLKVLSSKMVAGLTVFPALIFLVNLGAYRPPPFGSPTMDAGAVSVLIPERARTTGWPALVG